MSFNYNHTTLVGRLTHDPENKTYNERPKSTFTIAVNRPYKNKEGKTETDFINIVSWGKLAENCSNILRKGMPILIEGRIQIKSYEKENQKYYKTELVAENFQILEFLPKKKINK